jgi:hypothetical protein
MVVGRFRGDRESLRSALVLWLVVVAIVVAKDFEDVKAEFEAENADLGLGIEPGGDEDDDRSSQQVSWGDIPGLQTHSPQSSTNSQAVGSEFSPLGKTHRENSNNPEVHPQFHGKHHNQPQLSSVDVPNQTECCGLSLGEALYQASQISGRNPVDSDRV